MVNVTASYEYVESELKCRVFPLFPLIIAQVVSTFKCFVPSDADCNPGPDSI